MTEYHKIETLYERDPDTFKIAEPFVLKNRVYGVIKEFEWTEKLDGTNIRVLWNHTEEKVTFGGRTDNAQIPADLYNHLLDKFTAKRFKEVFPDTDVVIYGEGIGAGIQKGANYSPAKIFVAFDVVVFDKGGTDWGANKWWLSRENVDGVASKFNVPTAPYIGTMTLEAATEMVRKGISSRVGDRSAVAEGLVGRPVEALFDKKGHRVIVKLKTKDFAPVPAEKCLGGVGK